MLVTPDPALARLFLHSAADVPTNTALKRLAKITSAAEFDLYVDLHLGPGEFTLYASDLTEDYVALNKGDVNDPVTLGG